MFNFLTRATGPRSAGPQSGATGPRSVTLGVLNATRDDSEIVKYAFEPHNVHVEKEVELNNGSTMDVMELLRSNVNVIDDHIIMFMAVSQSDLASIRDYGLTPTTLGVRTGYLNEKTLETNAGKQIMYPRAEFAGYDREHIGKPVTLMLLVPKTNTIYVRGLATQYIHDAIPSHLIYVVTDDPEHAEFMLRMVRHADHWGRYVGSFYRCLQRTIFLQTLAVYLSTSPAEGGGMGSRIKNDKTTRQRKVHVGPNGGRYEVRSGRKVYLPKRT